MPFLRDILKDLNLYLREFRRKNTENSERIGRPGTYHLPALNVEQLRHWWGLKPSAFRNSKSHKDAQSINANLS